MTDTATSKFDLTPPTEDQLAGLVADLDDQERHVLLEHGTEAPFCGVFLDEKRPGVYTCRLCGLPLFNGGQKFESGTGWPSFTQPFRRSSQIYQRHQLRHGPNRDRLRPLWLAPGPCLPGRPAANRRALLHQLVSLEFTPNGEPLPDKLGRGAPEGEALGA